MTSRIRVLPALLACCLLAAGARASEAPTVDDAWARATPPGATVGAAYMTIQGGARADRLVDASCERAAMTHLHTVEEQGGVSRMRAVEAIEIPVGQRVSLAPKSTHVMLMGLDGPLVAGQTFIVRLRFAVAGELPVTVTVKPATATGEPSHSH